MRRSLRLFLLRLFLLSGVLLLRTFAQVELMPLAPQFMPPGPQAFLSQTAHREPSQPSESWEPTTHSRPPHYPQRHTVPGVWQFDLQILTFTMVQGRDRATQQKPCFRFGAWFCPSASNAVRRCVGMVSGFQSGTDDSLIQLPCHSDLPWMWCFSHSSGPACSQLWVFMVTTSTTILSSLPLLTPGNHLW